VTGNKDQQLPNKRPRARDYFNLDKRWEWKWRIWYTEDR
jgi:hypothetical protein